MNKLVEKPVAFAASIVFVLITLVTALSVHRISANLYYKTNLLKLQTAADLAVLAGAEYLPTDPRRAAQTAATYANYNGVAAKEILLVGVDPDKRTVRIRLNRKIPIYIALFAGLPGRDITVTAAAQSGSDRLEAPPREIPLGAI